MPTNGATLTNGQKRQLAGPVLSTPFDYDNRLYASFKDGKVFDYGHGTAREMREMLRVDGGARKVDQVLTLPLRSAAWEIRQAPGGEREYRWIRAQFDNLLGKVIDQCTTAVVYRKAFFELELALDGDQLAVKGVHYRPPATCEQGFDGKTGTPDGFRQRIATPGGLIAIQPTTTMSSDAPGYVRIPETRSFVYVHGSYREPIDGISDLDVAYWCFETKRKLTFLLCQYLEQQSLPKIVVYGDDETQAGKNADELAEANASAVIGLPRPTDPAARAFDLVESSGKGADQFLAAIGYLEGQMSASVLAGFTDLTSLANNAAHGGGSYALSADQSEFFLSARQAVADEISGAISEELFAKLCRMQFGADCKPPTLEIGPLSKRDKERAMGMLNALLTADHFNAPPGLIDLLIKSTAGYLGLPVDQVAQLVDDHPTPDPMAATPDAGAAPEEQPTDEPAAPVGQAVDPMDQVRQLAGLAHGVNVAHELVARSLAGEQPADVALDVQRRRDPPKRHRKRNRRR